MSADADQLKQRRSDLEDQLLGVLEERDPLDARLAELGVARDAVDRDRIRLQATLSEEEGAIDDELVVEQEARESQAAAFGDPTVLRTYEQLRKRMGGVGAARLVGNACGGCHLVLAAQEVDRIRRLPPDELVSCEQCGRILWFHGAWTARGVFWWPFFGWSFHGARLPVAHRPVLILVAEEAAGAAALLWAWHRFRMRETERRRRFLRTGYLGRDVA
jgi:hypothetical protein